MKFKFIKFSILFLSLVLLQFSSAKASCDFEIDVGKKFSKKHEKKFGPLVFDEKTKYSEIFLTASDVCNGIGFDNITVKYTFVDKVLGSIAMFVENKPDKNRTTENLILMNFAKSKFGDFDDAGNPKFYNGYNMWNLNKDKYAIYLKLKVDDNLWREELEISSREMRQVINAASNSDGVNPIEFKEKN